MKGQISIDYYVALIIFIFFVVYFLFQASNLVPQFLSQMETQRMQVETYQMSEILINDAGSPLNWNTLLPNNTANITRIGLSSDAINRTNVVSSAKMAALGSICSTQGQQFLRSNIATDLQFSVIMIDRNNTGIRFDCEPAVPNRRSFSINTTRVVAFDDGDYGEMILQVWQS